MSNPYEPGAYVTLAGAPEWGVGQIQSVAGNRVTVNFEHAGKRVINVAQAELLPASPDSHPQPERSAP